MTVRPGLLRRQRPQNSPTAAGSRSSSPARSSPSWNTPGRPGRNAIFRGHLQRERDRGRIDQDRQETFYVTRVSGAAVFMAGSPKGTPIALLHHVKANRAAGTARSSCSASRPRTCRASPRRSGSKLRDIGEGMWRAIGKYGYMESPDVRVRSRRDQGGGRPRSTPRRPRTSSTGR